MRKAITCCVLFFIAHINTGFSQAKEANLLGTWSDATLPIGNAGGPYNECWGVYQNGAEIGIIGSTMGTHFVDISNPNNPIEITKAFIPGASQGTHIVHRDYHDLGSYLYAVADEGASTLQVIDISNLPDTAFVVYDSDEILIRAHNIFIDSTSQRMYVSSARLFNGYSPLAIIDISIPDQPVLMAQFSNIGGLTLGGSHDIYVKNDTAYINVGYNGLYIVDFTDLNNVTVLGSLTSYLQQGYNHSGWLDTDGEYYYFADETHGKDMKTLRVTDFTDLEVVNYFDADSSNDGISIPHNLIVHCGLLYVSHYYDGLQVYDLTNPAAPERIYYYDTYLEPDKTSYAGAWGVFPLFPSGNVIISDVQSGMFVFEAIPLSNTDQCTADLVPTIELGNTSFQKGDLRYHILKINEISGTASKGTITITFSELLGFDMGIQKNIISAKINNEEITVNNSDWQIEHEDGVFTLTSDKIIPGYGVSKIGILFQGTKSKAVEKLNACIMPGSGGERITEVADTREELNNCLQFIQTVH